MNILPFVLSILIILGITGSTLSQGHIAMTVEKSAITGYLNAHCKRWNKQEQALYTKATREIRKRARIGAKAEKAPTAPKESKSSIPVEEIEEEDSAQQTIYFRQKKCSYESGKFALAPLLGKLEGSALQTYVYEKAAELIRMLYAKAPFWKEEEHYEFQILDALVKMDPETPLYHLFPKDSLLEQVFYRMLKGTNTYQLEKDIGYPPFLDFFRVEPRPTSTFALNFQRAPQPLLKVLLGKELTEKIETMEKSSNTSLTQKEWEALLQAYPQKKTELEQIKLKFSTHEPATIVVTDSRTGINTPTL